jgi:hypothetical protein
MNKITVVCHKDHSHGYEDFEGRCLLCVIDALLLEIGNLMVQKQNFAPITDVISPSVIKAISKREWVGLATEEARKFYESDLSREELIHKIDEFLQEKNNG